NLISRSSLCNAPSPALSRGSKTRRGRGLQTSTRFLKVGFYGSQWVGSRPLFFVGRSRTSAEQGVSDCELLLRTNNLRIRHAHLPRIYAAKGSTNFHFLKIQCW